MTHIKSIKDQLRYIKPIQTLVLYFSRPKSRATAGGLDQPFLSLGSNHPHPMNIKNPFDIPNTSIFLLMSKVVWGKHEGGNHSYIVTFIRPTQSLTGIVAINTRIHPPPLGSNTTLSPKTCSNIRSKLIRMVGSVKS